MSLDDAILAAHRRGAASAPDVRLATEAFADYLAHHPRGAIDAASLDDDACAELYLACACAAGDVAALARLDRSLRSWVPAAVAHMRLDRSRVDGLCQTVREKLLVGDAPRLLEYAGRGRLRGLVQVVAVRAAISELRKHKREVGFGDGELERLEDADPDPALGLMKASYREAFKAGFERAVRGLDSRQRNLLRLHLLGGVTLERLASMYGVHRATVVRWLARARDQVQEATRAHMRDALGVDASELDSVMGLIQSRLDASVQRVLRTFDGALPAADDGADADNAGDD